MTLTQKKVKKGNKRAECLGDLIEAKYIQFPNNSSLFMVDRSEWDDVKIWLDDSGNIMLVGRVTQVKKGIKISRMFMGIAWESRSRFSEIICIAK